MAESKRERRGHFRGKARPGRRVEVRYRILDGGQLGDEQRAFTKNIGVGGAFIMTTHPPPPGTALQIALTVPAASRALEVRGDVRWVIDEHEPEAEGEDAGGDERGMGVKFAGLDVDQLMALNEYFGSLTSTMDHDEATTQPLTLPRPPGASKV
ncbi:MAG TPA: PilZ domain-containing protein [Polyangia bacterium]|nr:PilZ domain-containing protein [Polyangia bacterium]